MSLFCTYDWWSAHCEEKCKTIGKTEQEDEIDFHHRSLHLTDFVQNGLHIVLVGSYSGKLWAFKPTSSNSPQDLLFEYNFGNPILAFESGNLLPRSTKKHLAILHPKQVTIYSLHESFGNAAHGQQFQLEPVYSISFQFTAYSIVIGPFGSGAKTSGAKEGKERSGWGRNAPDAICVQAMDGSLHFYENDINVMCVSSKNTLENLPLKQEKVSKQLGKDAMKGKSGSKSQNIIDVTKAEVHGCPSADYFPPKSNMEKLDSANNEISDASGVALKNASKGNKVEGTFQQLGNEDIVNSEDTIQILKAKFSFGPFEDTHLPTLLCYLPSEDCFIIFSGSWTIDCYRYSTLLMQQISSRRKKLTLPEWSYVLGEPIFSLSCIQGNIFALGIRGTLVGLNPFGVQNFCKKLCFSPSALCSYLADEKLMVLIASEEGTLMVYDGGSITGCADCHTGCGPSASTSCTPMLVWSAKLPFVPVTIAKANFEELSGLVVILSDDGHLQCCHLGTTPKSFTSLPTTRLNQIQEDKEAEEELMQPTGKQAEIQSYNASKGAVELSLELVIESLKLHPVVEEIRTGRYEGYNDGEKIISWNSILETEISLTLNPMIPLNNVCVCARCESPLEVSLGSNFIERLYEEVRIPLVVRANFHDHNVGDMIPNISVEVAVSCFGGCSGSGEELSLMIFHTSIMLPPTAVFSKDQFHVEDTQGVSVSQESSNEFKKFEFSFHGYNCPSIEFLFPEFFSSPYDSNLSTLDLFQFGHACKKVQLARSCNEENDNITPRNCVYSVGSCHSLPLYFVATILAQKLENHVAELGIQVTGNTVKQKAFFNQVTPKNPAPLNELLSTIDSHALARQNVIQHNIELGCLINQLHMVECCILSKVKDTSPKPIMFSEMLLEPFLEKIFSGINNLMESKHELNLVSKKIFIISKFMMQLQSGLSQNSALRTFRNSISNAVEDTITQGWEERCKANLTFVLHGQRTPNVNQCSGNNTQAAIYQENLINIDILKKEIMNFVEKLNA